MSYKKQLYNDSKYIIEKIKQIKSAYHYDVLTILNKYDIKHSKNKNGFFFDLSDISPVIVDEINEFLKSCDVRESLFANSYDEDTEPYLNNPDSALTNLNKDNNVMLTQINKISIPSPLCLREECKQIVETISDLSKSNIESILAQVEKDKTMNSKKYSINKFTVAKKKYGKQVINDTKRNDYRLEYEY